MQSETNKKEDTDAIKFMKKACQIVIKHRMIPQSQVKYEQHCQKLKQTVQKSAKIDNSLYLQIEVRLRDRPLPIKVEQWCFSCFVAEKGLDFKMQQQKEKEVNEAPPSLAELQRIVKSRPPIDNILQTIITATFDKRALGQLQQQNTYQMLIDYHETTEAAYSINLTFNYTIDEDQEEFQQLPEMKTYALTEMSQNTVSPNPPRKYSQGIDVVEPRHFASSNNIDKKKIQSLQKMLQGIDFRKIEPMSTKNALEFALK